MISFLASLGTNLIDCRVYLPLHQVDTKRCIHRKVLIWYLLDWRPSYSWNPSNWLWVNLRDWNHNNINFKKYIYIEDMEMSCSSRNLRELATKLSVLSLFLSHTHKHTHNCSRTCVYVCVCIDIFFFKWSTPIIISS